MEAQRRAAAVRRVEVRRAVEEAEEEAEEEASRKAWRGREDAIGSVGCTASGSGRGGALVGFGLVGWVVGCETRKGDRGWKLGFGDEVVVCTMTPC